MMSEEEQDNQTRAVPSSSSTPWLSGYDLPPPLEGERVVTALRIIEHPTLRSGADVSRNELEEEEEAHRAFFNAASPSLRDFGDERDTVDGDSKPATVTVSRRKKQKLSLGLMREKGIVATARITEGRGVVLQRTPLGSGGIVEDETQTKARFTSFGFGPSSRATQVVAALTPNVVSVAAGTNSSIVCCRGANVGDSSRLFDKDSRMCLALLCIDMLLQECSKRGYLCYLSIGAIDPMSASTTHSSSAAAQEDTSSFLPSTYRGKSVTTTPQEASFRRRSDTGVPVVVDLVGQREDSSALPLCAPLEPTTIEQPLFPALSEYNISTGRRPAEMLRTALAELDKLQDRCTVSWDADIFATVTVASPSSVTLRNEANETSGHGAKTVGRLTLLDLVGENKLSKFIFNPTLGAAAAAAAAIRTSTAGGGITAARDEGGRNQQQQHYNNAPESLLAPTIKSTEDIYFKQKVYPLLAFGIGYSSKCFILGTVTTHCTAVDSTLVEHFTDLRRLIVYPGSAAGNSGFTATGQSPLYLFSEVCRLRQRVNEGVYHAEKDGLIESLAADFEKARNEVRNLTELLAVRLPLVVDTQKFDQHSLTLLNDKAQLVRELEVELNERQRTMSQYREFLLSIPCRDGRNTVTGSCSPGQMTAESCAPYGSTKSKPLLIPGAATTSLSDAAGCPPGLSSWLGQQQQRECDTISSQDRLQLLERSFDALQDENKRLKALFVRDMHVLQAELRASKQVHGDPTALAPSDLEMSERFVASAVYDPLAAFDDGRSPSATRGRGARRRSRDDPPLGAKASSPFYPSTVGFLEDMTLLLAERDNCDAQARASLLIDDFTSSLHRTSSLVFDPDNEVNNQPAADSCQLVFRAALDSLRRKLGISLSLPNEETPAERYYKELIFQRYACRAERHRLRGVADALLLHIERLQMGVDELCREIDTFNREFLTVAEGGQPTSSSGGGGSNEYSSRARGPGYLNTSKTVSSIARLIADEMEGNPEAPPYRPLRDPTKNAPGAIARAADAKPPLRRLTAVPLMSAMERIKGVVETLELATRGVFGSVSSLEALESDALIFDRYLGANADDVDESCAEGDSQNDIGVAPSSRDGGVGSSGGDKFSWPRSASHQGRSVPGTPAPALAPPEDDVDELFIEVPAAVVNVRLEEILLSAAAPTNTSSAGKGLELGRQGYSYGGVNRTPTTQAAFSALHQKPAGKGYFSQGLEQQQRQQPTTQEKRGVRGRAGM